VGRRRRPASPESIPAEHLAPGKATPIACHLRATDRLLSASRTAELLPQRQQVCSKASSKQESESDRDEEERLDRARAPGRIRRHPGTADLEKLLRACTSPGRLRTAQETGIADLGDFAYRKRLQAEGGGEWIGTAPELWSILFIEHRAARFARNAFDRDPLLDALCTTLRFSLQIMGHEERALLLRLMEREKARMASDETWEPVYAMAS
jgi:hypothetical protein